MQEEVDEAEEARVSAASKAVPTMGADVYTHADDGLRKVDMGTAPHATPSCPIEIATCNL